METGSIHGRNYFWNYWANELEELLCPGVLYDTTNIVCCDVLFRVVRFEWNVVAKYPCDNRHTVDPEVCEFPRHGN